ncbi:MAG: adenylate/guanylate cyclase domain-containing protein [Gammaproteobacteria bacterium]|nr:adenylate/guanylate cyclase domain-containing protein [Gammaproteobacteria bacterium]
MNPDRLATRSTEVTPADVSPDATVMFLRAEQTGLKLAIICRTIALVLLGIWLLGSRADDPVRLLNYIIALTVFAGLGLAHYSLIATRFDRPWIKYVFVTLDIAIVSALVATQPLYQSAADLPAVFVFRTPIFPFYFIILGIAALSFSPGLVLWAGIAGALGWLGAFLHLASGVEGLLNWSQIPPNPTAEEVMAIVLDPDFGGLSGRIQEIVSLAVVALLIAVVMWRARSTLERQLEAERDRAAITGIFGRFVPQAIVDAMIEGRGTLAPIEREATVLFADIAGFTEMTERAGPVRTVNILNAYFDEVTRIIGAHNGIVTQFQGDAVLATFNVPVADAGHAENAFEAACAILACVAEREFAGEQIRVRIGINTGPLVAGNVGGGGRQSYTVHGDAVNLAARLEALCKEHGTPLLVSASTARALPNAKLVAAGDIAVRGLSKPVTVFSLATEHDR